MKLINGKLWKGKTEEYLIVPEGDLSVFIPKKFLTQIGNQFGVDEQVWENALQNAKPRPRTQMEILKELEVKIDSILDLLRQKK